MLITILGVQYKIDSIMFLTNSVHIIYKTDLGLRAVNLGQAQFKNQVSIIEPQVNF